MGCSAPAEVTTSPALRDYPARVAVLPCQVILTNRPIKAQWYDEQQMEELARSMSIAMQGILYNKMKQRSEQKGIVTTFQSVDLTNATLANEKISFATLFASNKKSICELLGVDAVIAPQLVLAEAPKESLAEVGDPYWSVRFNASLFTNALDNPAWTFKGMQGGSKSFQIWNAGPGRAKDYATVLRSFQVPIETLLKKMIKEYPFKKKDD
jgi:hypothetical protein